QLGESSLLGPSAETVEGAEGHILLVVGAPRSALELVAGQVDQAREVALPEPLGGLPAKLFWASCRKSVCNPTRPPLQSALYPLRKIHWEHADNVVRWLGDTLDRPTPNGRPRG